MNKIKNVLLYGLLLCGVAMFQSCEKDMVGQDLNPDSMTSQNLGEIIDFDLGEEQVKIDEEITSKRTFGYFSFRTLNAALACTGLNSALFEGRKTLYAPSDAAFAKLGLNEDNICELGPEALTAILIYHVAEGSIKLSEKGCLTMLNGDITQLKRTGFRFYINDSRIYLSWRQKSLRLYAIDQVLTPPEITIAEAAASTNQFSTLFAAVLAADPAIAAALSDPSASWTVFAPTNEAFGDLLAALNLSSLEEVVVALGVEGLSKVLLYHVIDGCAFSNDLRNGQMLTTLQGEAVSIDLRRLQVIDKTETPASLDADGLDILTNNGVIHTIDKVLLPKEIIDLLGS
jgi:transforming growth factor-beta-induced protein